MGIGAITTHLDVAQLVLYAFWIFFAGLCYYLCVENHREGYPMDADRGKITGWPLPREPKVFKLSDGRDIEVPNPLSQQTLNARRLGGHIGAPIEPVGNPLLAGVGPGAWADRFDRPDLDFHGQPRIVPLRTQGELSVDSYDTDPRGLPLYDADGERAGTIKDLWVDVADMLFRYLEVRLADDSRTVLVPMNFCRVNKRGVHVKAIYKHQFADVPATRSAESITSLEEEKIQAYFGAGLLYADADRAEPLV